MKKIVAFIGSPRKGKNTAIIVDRLIEGMDSPEITAEKFYLADYDISGCKGCYGCSKIGKCVLNDDMTHLYSKFESADGLIFASPSHNYNITSFMKALIDRLNCYFEYNDDGFRSRLPGKKQAIIIGICGGPDEEFMGYTVRGMSKPIKDLQIPIFKEISYYNTVQYPIKHNTGFQNEMIELGKEFADALTRTV